MNRPAHPRSLTAAGLILAAALATTPSVAQTPKQVVSEVATEAAASDYKAPRNVWGQPDIAGIWNQDHFVLIESAPGVPLTLPEEQAHEYWLQATSGMAQGFERGLDPELPDLMRNTNGLPLVRGERRTRSLILPESGALPYTAKGREEHEAGAIRPVYDSYEVRPGWERCLIGLGLPPITNVGLAGENPRQIFQTKDHVVIYTEYGAEARIIPYADEHHPTPIHSVLGDAIARWEGETLVVETVGVSEVEMVRTISNLVVSSNATVIERYTLIGEDELLYQYSVIDPEMYSEPWLAEYSLFPTDQHLYEASCHEGNYGLPNILKGARQIELRGEDN